MSIHLLLAMRRHRRPTAMSFDEVLIGEIEPAMRDKLESDGRRAGLLVGLIILMLAAYADYFVLPSLLEQALGADAIVATLIRHLSVAFMSLLILPGAMKRSNLRAELKYRRQHGKWRWER